MSTYAITSRLVLTILLIVTIMPAAMGHSLFNSSEQFIAGHRVQVSTLPEFPQIGEPSDVLFRITDLDFEELPGAIIGIRINYNDVEVYSDGPRVIEGAHNSIKFVFENPGNHLLYVDLYGLKDVQSEKVTYTFNISTQSPFGYIFFLSIMVGGLVFSMILGYIYLPGIIKRRRS